MYHTAKYGPHASTLEVYILSKNEPHFSIDPSVDFLYVTPFDKV